MENQDTGSGGGAAVAVVMILVLLAGFCLIGVLVGGFFFLGVSRVSTPAIATPPVPTVVKAANATRMVVLTIASDSSLMLEGAPVELDAVPDRIQQLRAASPGTMLEVAIDVDPAMPFQGVNDVLQKLSAVGVPYHIRSRETEPDQPATVNSAPTEDPVIGAAESSAESIP